MIVGRIITADGQDIQDDYTVPIEKQFLMKPLDWILKYTYFPARGIPIERAKVQVRFMLAEAQSGLGWLDVGKSPADLGLKDSDIVEVLVTRSKKAGDEQAVAGDESKHWAGSWQEAVAFFGAKVDKDEARWVQKAWAALETFAQDDNVVVPGLTCLQKYKKPKQVLGALGTAEILQKILTVNSKNAKVQAAGWGLAADLAGEASVQAQLTQRSGLRKLALKFKESPEVQDKTAAANVAKFITALAKFAGGDGATKSKSPKRSTESEIAPKSPVAEAKTGKQTCETAAKKLAAASQAGDMMAIEKVLRLLTKKMNARELEYKDVASAGLGKLFGELRGHDGDADIRELATKAVNATAKLQYQTC